MKSGRSVDHSYGIPGPGNLLHHFFKPVDITPYRRNIGGIDRFQQVFFFIAGKLRLVKRNKAFRLVENGTDIFYNITVHENQQLPGEKYIFNSFENAGPASSFFPKIIDTVPVIAITIIAIAIITAIACFVVDVINDDGKMRQLSFYI